MYVMYFDHILPFPLTLTRPPLISPDPNFKKDRERQGWGQHSAGMAHMQKEQI